MDIGIGIDGSLGLSLQDQDQVSRAAARLGYSSIWTPEGPGLDSFHLCQLRWAATAGAVDGGLTTGISVSPVSLRGPVALAMSAGTLSRITGGKFLLGIGVGGLYQEETRNAFGVSEVPPVRLMREYLTTLNGLLAGEVATYEGTAVNLRGVQLAFDSPPRTPVYLGALGPQMLRLAGQLADGAALNWCTPEQIAWSRERVAEGEAKAGREPGSVKIVEYIRMCVDEDEDQARRAFVAAMLGYALGQPGTQRPRGLGYRAHFDRMGFADILSELDEMRNKGEPEDRIVDAVPPDMALRVGYFGKPSGAAEAFRKLSQGLDTAVARVVVTRPGVESVSATMEACKP